MISHLLNIVYGIVFGVANVIPGVSGGTMMVVFGVYDKVVDVLTLKLSAIKRTSDSSSFRNRRRYRYTRLFVCDNVAV